MPKSIQERLKRLEFLYKCICQNPVAGPPGPQGPPGNAAEACPDHLKLGAVSGKITVTSKNSPDIEKIFVGNNELGWSLGNYNYAVSPDSFGNLITFKHDDTFLGIPLPIDLNQGDMVKITGVVNLTLSDPAPVNPTFYVTVSYFNCSEVTPEVPNTPLYTVIPVASYPVNEERKVCFSESVSLGSVLPADETFFIVGLTMGNDGEPPIQTAFSFSYSLDVSQACVGEGSNLLIRNCCDPAYSEVIIDNGVPVGESFVDDEGNCWTVEERTTNAVTSTRVLSNSYEDCTACIANNPCPENFEIQACCGDVPEVFSAALTGVDVGDTFVDANGFCWGVIGTTGGPITNVVQVDTVYPSTDCDSAECQAANECPKVVELVSCCGSLSGHTTLQILQATLPTLEIGETFVDTFGMCWQIGESSYAFPSLSFIIPATEYENCETCINDNECPKDYYYTLQNCCTEEVEVALLNAVYSVGNVLSLVSTTGFGCYEVLSWSDTGTETILVEKVFGTSKTCRDCQKSIAEKYGEYCPGQVLRCTTYANKSETSGNITGYTCEGNWIVDFALNPNDTICMAQVFGMSENISQGGVCCSFDILNPSLTEFMEVFVGNCEGSLSQPIIIPPNTLASTVIAGLPGVTETCINFAARTQKDDNDFVYVPCV